MSDHFEPVFVIRGLITLSECDILRTLLFLVGSQEHLSVRAGEDASTRFSRPSQVMPPTNKTPKPVVLSCLGICFDARLILTLSTFGLRTLRG